MGAAAVATAALLLWALAIAVVDWRWRKVPNALLIVLLLPAVLALALDGSGLLGASWLASAIGLVVGFAVTLPGHLVGKLGAGDVKLAAVVGLVVGWPLAATALLIAGLMLGAMALFTVMHLGLGGAKSLRMPAAVAFAGGFATVVVAQRGGWL